jgi:hypothetical protein
VGPSACALFAFVLYSIFQLFVLSFSLAGEVVQPKGTERPTMDEEDQELISNVADSKRHYQP